MAEMSDSIIVNARVLTDEKQLVAKLQVGINELIGNIKDYFNVKGAAFNVIYKGDLVKKEDTYLKKLVPSHTSTIFLIAGSLQPQKWKRFGRMVTTDYFYMSETYWDAIMFKPKMDIFFLGFGFNE
jgi:hypothetical protein